LLSTTTTVLMWFTRLCVRGSGLLALQQRGGDGRRQQQSGGGQQQQFQPIGSDDLSEVELCRSVVNAAPTLAMEDLRQAYVSLTSGRLRQANVRLSSGVGVPPEVWDFHIGGYQVCEKWLEDRRGRALSYEDLEHPRKVVTALSETIRLMAEIDAAIPKWPIE